MRHLRSDDESDNIGVLHIVDNRRERVIEGKDYLKGRMLVDLDIQAIYLEG